MVRIGVRSLSFGIAAVTLGFILKISIMPPSTPEAEFPVVRAGFSTFAKILPDRVAAESPRPADRLRLASLDPQIPPDALTEEDAIRSETGASVLPKGVSFAERFASLDDRVASFDERFETGKPELTGNVRVAPDREDRDAERSLVRLPDAPPIPPVSKRQHIRPGQAHRGSTPALNAERTAIYDISARVVYLPNGRRLEAHSGLGQFMDNPRHVHLRMRGSTPPNVYRLSLRERLFHGVRALRMTPTDEGKMHGRAGILAHTYMLGPSGQSNGCVSFKNYSEFLNSYLNGEITHIAVVDRLDNPPGPKVASGWLTNLVSNLFSSSDRSPAYADAGAQ